MSTNTGFALSYRVQLLDAMKLNGVAMTFSGSPALKPWRNRRGRPELPPSKAQI